MVREKLAAAPQLAAVLACLMARPKILVFQHVSFEPLGTLDPILREAGFRIRYVNFGRDPELVPSLDGYAGLVILGGVMNVDDVENHPNLATELNLVQEAVDRDISILGICLGAQLLAKALGGTVRQGPNREIGWYDVDVTEEGRRDPVLSAFGARSEVFQWHEDNIELPANVVHLASSPLCHSQAFRYGEHAYGFQFHLEVTQPIVERWLPDLKNDGGRHDNRNFVHAEQIRGQMVHSMEPLMALSRRTFSRWVDHFELAPRRHTFSSGH
jgi:GMP synthase (glutamine-hydrolysing)